MDYAHLIEVKELDDGSGDCYIEFPPELMNKLSWSEGDELSFDHQEDGSIIIKKVEKVVK